MVPANPGAARPTMFATAFAAAFAALLPVSAAGPPATATALAQDGRYETGCARFRVRLRDRGPASVTRADGPACGTLRLVGARAARHDRENGRVRLEVALESAGGMDLVPPALVYGWDDSLRVTDAPGLARGRGDPSSLSFVDPDSVVPEGAADLPGARLWSFDPVLDPEDPPADGRLPAGKTSDTRWIEVAVGDGIGAFEVVLGARARPSLAVPATPPDSVPLAYYRDENVIPEAVCVLAPVLSNILVVSFTEGSDRAERSAAVAAVGGVVVGGLPLLDQYLVRVPDDGTGLGMCRAQLMLRFSKVIATAEPVMTEVSDHLVPPAPPDSVPRAYYRDENVIPAAPCTMGPLLSNILVVSFADGHSLEERSEAVAAVDGVVVGGRPAIGFYIILVPDDGTGAGLCDAEARLRASPAVSLAAPVMIAVPQQ